MYGAVFGDIMGSWYEWHNRKSEDIELFPREARFTDDTVLTVAVAESILHMEDNSPRKCYANHIKAYYRRYPGAGFGNMFKDWATSDHLSVQHSYGNGASMRVSAIGWAFDDEKEILTVFFHVRKKAFVLIVSFPKHIKTTVKIHALCVKNRLEIIEYQNHDRLFSHSVLSNLYSRRSFIFPSCHS